MPEVWGPVQIVAQCSDQTDLRDLSRVGARAVITPGATLSGKLGDGYRDTFDQFWCLIFLFYQACISLLHVPDPRAKRKTVLKVKCFKEASLIGSKWTFVSWWKKPGRGSRRGFPSGLWVCLSGNYPGDEWDFHPYWYWWANIPVYQQWLTCNHQWCWVATSCPETGT